MRRYADRNLAEIDVLESIKVQVRPPTFVPTYVRSCVPTYHVVLLLRIPRVRTCVHSYLRTTLAKVHRVRFRGGLVFEAHRLCASLDSRLESNNKEEKRCTRAPQSRRAQAVSSRLLSSPLVSSLSPGSRDPRAGARDRQVPGAPSY